MTDPGTGEPIVDEEGREIESPSQIEEWTESIRLSVPAKRQPVPGTVKTPDDVIQDLDEVDRLATQHAAVLREAERTARTLKRRHAVARAHAFKNAKGTVGDREADADRNPDALAAWEAADNAEIAHNYAKQVGRLIEGRGSHVQTQSKLVELTYHLAGRGRGA